MWDEPATRRYDLKPERLSSHGRILQLAEAWPRSSRILEVGTASGYLGRELRVRGFTHVVGLERDAKLAQHAQPYYHVHHLVDLEGETALKDLGEFDAVICADVLEHLRDPWKRLRDLGQLVRPSGQVVISVPNAVHWTVRLMVLSGRFVYRQRGLLDADHVRFFTYATARQLVEGAGLQIRRVIVTPLPFRYVFNGRLPQRFTQLIERSSYILSVSWKTLFAYQFILVAERLARTGQTER